MNQFPLRLHLVASASPRDRRRRLAGGGCVALLLALCPLGQGARAQDDWVEEEPRWIPSLRLGFDTFEYATEASVENTFNPPRHSGSANEDNRLFLFQIGAEVMGPIFEGLPGHPRLFAQAGAQITPVSSDNIFDNDITGDTEVDISQWRNSYAQDKARTGCVDPNCFPQPMPFQGEGAAIDAELQNPSWNAALGVAFTFPVADSLLLQVKPLVAYNLEKIDMSGTITTVVDTGTTSPVRAVVGGRVTFQPVPVLEVHRGSASTSVTQHSLGPGLELDLVLFRETRPVRASIYADARFLWLLSDRTTTMSDSVASYEVRSDTFGIRGGAGVRLSWVGFDGP